jgi:predicted nucleic acid-binding protein
VTTPSGSNWVIVDSSGWVEYMGGGPKANDFAPFLESSETLLLPSIVVYEVYKKLLRESGKGLAELFLSQAFGFRDRLVELGLELSLLAAKTSLETQLPMADAIIYATAHHYGARLLTSDAHFANLPGVTVV